jgi:hypothetical protein
VQAIKELALESPFELGMVQVAGMELEIIGVYGDIRIFELDDDLDAFALVAGGEVEQGMLVEAKLGEHAVETWVGRPWHSRILVESGKAPRTDIITDASGNRKSL